MAYLRCIPGRINLLYGLKPIYHLSHLAAGERLIKGERVAVIDGANRFSPGIIATTARRHRIDPRILLDRIVVSRAFTCYQMEAAVTERLPDFLVKNPSALLFILGPLDLFYDKQAPMHDVHRGLKRILDTFVRLRREGMTLLITSRSVPVPHGRGHLLTSLKTTADTVYRLEIGEKRFALLAEKITAGTKRVVSRNS